MRLAIHPSGRCANAGAQVRPNLQHKKRPGDTRNLGVGTRIETDDQGPWTYDYMPMHLKSFTVEVTHGDFKSTVTSLSSELFSLSDNQAPSARIVMEKGLDHVDFVMQPGGHVRIRVVDENSKPIPKARIFFQRWRDDFDYFEFDHVGQYADEDGVWEWNEVYATTRNE